MHKKIIVLSFAALMSFSEPRLCADGQAAPALVLGVHPRLFFPTLGLQPQEIGDGAGPIGYSIVAIGQDRALVYLAVGLTVHPTVDAAIEEFEYRQGHMSVGPTPSPERIGESFLLWAGPPGTTKIDPVPRESGTILFRRSNVVLSFGWVGELSAALELAHDMDDLIRDDREIAPMGQFAEPPAIVAVPLPTEDEAGTNHSIVPQVRGLGDPAKVVFSAETVFGPHQNVSDSFESKGKLKLRIPPYKRQNEIKITAVNEDNLVVTKIVTVRVRGGMDLPELPRGTLHPE